MSVVTVTMNYKFCHEDGSFVECQTIGEAMDSGDKATNKAMAVAHKYAILQTFCIPTEDLTDPDATAEVLAPQPVTQDQKQAQAQQQAQALFAYMKDRHGDNTAACLAELSDFFGRPVKASKELTQEEVASFLKAIKEG